MNAFLESAPWYQALLNSPLFALTLSLGCFKLGQWLYIRSRHFPLLHPTVFGACMVGLILPVLELDYQQYLQGNQLLLLLLGPATVALAIPLYQQLSLIRALFLPIVLTIVIGGSFAAISALGIAYAMGASTETLLSLSPKAVTTPIAIAIVNEIGGLPTLASGAVVFTAAIGIAMCVPLFRLLGIRDPRIWGFCMGLNAHGMGTSRAFELNATAGAFSSLAMCLNGSFSAVVIPLAASLLRQ